MKRLLLASAISALAACAPANASVIHTVGSGETLWSIAAANGFSIHALAAANGLSDNSQVVLGSEIKIPSLSEANQALAGGGRATAVGLQQCAKRAAFFTRVERASTNARHRAVIGAPNLPVGLKRATRWLRGRVTWRASEV